MKRQPRKKQSEDDSLNKKVIDELSEELGLTKTKIKHATQHFFGWQRQAFENLEYESYLWNYFGTFKIIPKKHKEYKNKQLTKTNKTDKNNGKKEEKSADKEQN